MRETMIERHCLAGIRDWDTYWRVVRIMARGRLCRI
jgi:hypothetical protein